MAKSVDFISSLIIPITTKNKKQQPDKSIITIASSCVKQESDYILYRMQPTARNARQIGVFKDTALKLRPQSKILNLAGSHKTKYIYTFFCSLRYFRLLI